MGTKRGEADEVRMAVFKGGKIERATLDRLLALLAEKTAYRQRRGRAGDDSAARTCARVIHENRNRGMNPARGSKEDDVKCRWCPDENAIHYLGGGLWACFRCWLRALTGHG